MEEELRFVCRLCNKRYPSGESLGDHMRCHVIENSAESGEKFEPNVRKLSSFLKINGGTCQDSTCEIGGQSGYGLRENPKKTWRAGIGGSKFPLPQRDQICKQCGKGFQSLKALCGHMACHSEKDRVLRDDHSWSTSDQKNQKMGFDWQSETEAEAGPRQRPKRAASLRYKRISARSCSSHVSEIDHEQEEVAMCLMMLSRDYGKWVGLDSAGESSDNNSAVLETRSSSIDMKIRRKNQFAVNSVQNSAKRKGELKSGVWEPKAVQYEKSDSGYFLNEANKVDSDVSVDGFLRNDDNCKKQKVDNGSELVKKGLDKGKCMGIEPRNGLAKGKGYGESGNPSTLAKFDTRRKKYESGSKKKQDFSFNQRKLKSKTKKSRGHECPVCHKVYKSGQALGGHKRSHFLGISEDKSNQIPVSKQEFSQTRDLLDLNLPVSVDEEEANELSQFMPW